MNTGWITERRITCLSEDGERIMVFRQKFVSERKTHPLHRYVLANSTYVEVCEDSGFRVTNRELRLRPMTF